jgi:hypothetical protein
MSTVWPNMFESEVHFLAILEQHDKLVHQCANGSLAFSDFLEKYDELYSRYALDGHESDDAERALFDKYEERIKLHERIAFEVMSGLCDESDAIKEAYIEAGRFGGDEALKRVRAIVSDFRFE